MLPLIPSSKPASFASVSYIDSEITQIFRSLNSDKAAADDHGRFWLVRIDIFFNFQCVLNGAEGEYHVAVSTIKIWLDRLSARREQELVITLGENCAGFKIFYGNALTFRVN